MNYRSKICRPTVLLVIAIAMVLISQWALVSLQVTQDQEPVELLLGSYKAGNTPSSLSSALSSSSSTLLESYDPARFPVFPLSSATTEGLKKKKLRVGIVTVDPLVGEAMHFLYDGVVGSDYLELVGTVSLYSGPNNTHPEIHLEPNDAQIWLVDGARVIKLKRIFLARLLEEAPFVVFVDWTDQFQYQLRKYHQHDVWKHANVRLAVRSIIQGRHFNGTSQTIRTGKITANLPTKGGPTLHCPYSVRSDIVETVMALLGMDKKSFTALQTTTTTSLHDDALATLEHAICDASHTSRPVDVIHMWQISFKEGKSKLRNLVSKLVRGLNGTELADNGGMTRQRPILTSIEEKGERRKVGRNTVNSNYVQAMLESKIVVVTQKDDWEDHYRLFEAIVCGPLVLADRMLAPPAGLVDHENIVFFDNITHLQDQIFYYLGHDQERQRIARHGWKLAMTRHRSWHRMEEILLGRPLTTARLLV